MFGLLRFLSAGCFVSEGEDNTNTWVRRCLTRFVWFLSSPGGRDQDVTSSLCWQTANRMMTSDSQRWLHRNKVRDEVKLKTTAACVFTSHTMSCFTHSPMNRHHHILGGRVLGAHGRPECDGIRAEGKPHLLHPGVHRPRRVGSSRGPRHLQRLYREKLRTHTHTHKHTHTYTHTITPKHRGLYL